MRDVIKALSDYERLRWTARGISIFRKTDAAKLRAHHRDYGMTPEVGDEVLLDALRAGYAIGYKHGRTAGEKDAKEAALDFFGTVDADSMKQEDTI